MRKTLLLATGLSLTLSALSLAQETPVAAPAPTTGAPTTAPALTPEQIVERVSYGFGLNVGRDLANNMKEYDVKLDLVAIQQGLRDGLDGTTAPKCSEADLLAAFQAFQSTLMEKETANQQVKMEKATAEGKAFLDLNKSAAGVHTTASGLQYQILAEGTGPAPKATDTVKVHYTGTLVDGTKFDSSVDRGEPAEFALEGVIKGWTEGIQLLKVGTKAKLFVPADLAYGMRSPSPLIPPNSTLIFDVELLEIVANATEPTMPTTPPDHTQQP